MAPSSGGVSLIANTRFSCVKQQRQQRVAITAQQQVHMFICSSSVQCLKQVALGHSVRLLDCLKASYLLSEDVRRHVRSLKSFQTDSARMIPVISVSDHVTRTCSTQFALQKSATSGSCHDSGHSHASTHITEARIH
eukprot:2270-Heterococcus_DN1.PRE.5